MHACFFEIRYETGKNERIEVEGDRILLGSGAHCDLRLAPEVAAWEHVVLTAEGEGMVARLIAKGAHATVDGASFRQAQLVDGSRIRIGEIELIYRVSTAARAGKRKRAPSFALLLAVLFVPAVLFVAAHARSNDAFGPPDKVPPPLGEVATQCPAETREQALALAREKDASAQAKRQRWKFHTRDGVEAVVLFEVAAACHAAGGDAEGAASSGLLARAMRAGVLQEFQVYRVRLERALERNDARVALAQIKYLRDMLFTRDIDDEYVRWLTIMQRKLEAKVSREG
jgi:hypothetical protein